MLGEEGNEDNNEDSESHRLANTPGSVHSLADPKFRTFTPNMNTSSMAYNNVEEEADKWLEKSSWDSSMPGLRKNYPSSLAKYSTPGGANPNEWRDKIKYSRDGWAHRVERYRLNKQSFHDLLRKRAGLTPSASEANPTGEGREDLSKTVSNQIGAPKEWGSRATTPGLLNEDDK